MTSLKSFIKSVRAAKTIADERAAIQRESAAIRTSFREEHTDLQTRRSNIQKLLYLFTLGEPTHFGQVECLKLLASPHFVDKRLGYLGTMLLLDENQEVLTLLTNSLSNDLNHPNQYIVGLALCTLGNIASPELARDLYPDIEKLITSPNPYIKKKAALCAARIVKKAPDLNEIFVDRAKLLLQDKNHGVLLAAIDLVEELCEQEPDLIDDFKTYIPALVRHLKALTNAGYTPEHDVLGVTDPFLQVKILHLLSTLTSDNGGSAPESMNDILAAVASNTDGSKNVGNAVLYESVRTIFNTNSNSDSDSGLRVLGINILGKFLSNKDNNTRYVALNTLLKVVELEPLAVQRHRATIISCLDDNDISIRRRALELAFAIINDQNVRVLTRELLSFLERADSDLKTFITSSISNITEKHSPNLRWRFDTLLRMLNVAGNYITEQVVSEILALLMQTTDSTMKKYVVQKLYASMKKDLTQHSLLLVGIWASGEYANLLISGGSFQDEETTIQISTKELIDLYDIILKSPFGNQSDIVCYTLTSLIKLSTNGNATSAELDNIRRIIQSKRLDLDIEIQQRVAEYLQILVQNKNTRKGILESMPAPPHTEKIKEESLTKSKGKSKREAGSASNSGRGNLLDFDDDNGSISTPQNAGGNDVNDLLSDIFGSSSQPAAKSTSTPLVVAPAVSTNQSILDLFGPSPSVPPASNGYTPNPNPVSTTSTNPTYLAFTSDHISISFTPHLSTSTPGSATITATIASLSPSTISNLSMLVAVPKSQKLQLQPISNNTISNGLKATQILKISGNAGASVKLRCRISYLVNGNEEVQQQFDYKFDDKLL